MESSGIRKATGWAALLGLLLFEYWPVLWNNSILTRDDTLLLGPLRSLRSISDYLADLQSGNVLDVQPLRDLSLWVDVAVSRHFTLDTFHLSNLLIWVLILVFVRRILVALVADRMIALGAWAIFAVDPLFVNSVAWISARKHLLAALLIFAATDAVIKTAAGADAGSSEGDARIRWRIPFLYLGSLLSQPIAILWPAWAWIYGRGSAACRRTAYACLPVFLALSWLNYRYYSKTYVAVTHFMKLGQFGRLDVVTPLFALGRYFFQLIAPFWLSTSYYEGSPRNLIGLLLIPVFGLFCFRYLPRKRSFNWGLFAALPLSIVTIKMTNVFVSDTYLLIPSLGFAVLAASLAGRFPRLGWVRWKGPLLACGLTVVALSGFGRSVAETWASDYALWKNAFQVERSPRSVVSFGGILLARGAVHEAYLLADSVLVWASQDPAIPEFYARATYLDPGFSNDEKLQKLLALPLQTGRSKLYLGWLYGRKGAYVEAFSALQEATRDTGMSGIGDAYPIACADAYRYCQLSQPAVRCESFLQERMHPSSSLGGGKPWDQAAFDEEYERVRVVR